MKTAFFILGMHRSGTSALGGSLNLLGLEFGSDLIGADVSNPKGYFENSFINQLNEKILKESGSAWSDYRFDISMIDKTKRELYKKEAKEIIENEFRYATNFAIKDPRICLLFPFWEEVCLELDIAIKIIIPYRNPVEVAASLKKRDGFSYEKSLILWSKHFLSAEYLSRNYERMFTSFDELITDTENIVKLLESFTGMEAPKNTLEKIKNDFLDSSVKHNNISLLNFTQETPLFLQKILQVIKEKTFEEKMLDEIRRDFLFSLEFFQHKEIFDTIDIMQQEVQKANFENEMLKKLTDIAKLDAEYYLAKNEDIRNAGVDPFKHYYFNGKKEGRIPNLYCEYHNLNISDIVSTEESFYIQAKQIEDLSKKLQTTTQTLQETAHAKTELEQEKTNQAQALHTLKAEYAALQEEKAQLGANLDAVLNDLANVKEAKAQQKAELENQIAHITKELQTTTQTLQETAHAKTELEQEKTNQAQALHTLKAEYAALQEEKAQLGANLDAVLNDLANVKEAKAQQKAELENQIAHITKELQTTTQTLQETAHAKTELEQEKTNQAQALHTLKAEYAALQEEKAQLGANLDAVLNDLANVKEAKAQQKAELENQIAHITKELQTTTQTLQETAHAKTELEQEKTNQAQVLETLNTEHLALNTKYSKLQEEYTQKLQEAQELESNLDAVVNDLACIKESKCWIYTKPIRDLQKALKGKE